jgi:hypothetical protein
MLVGDNRRFLSCLISLKEDPTVSGNIDKLALDFLSIKGCEVKKISEAKNSPQIRKIIM